MVSLTDMWKASGSPKHKESWRWKTLPQTAEFMAKVSNHVKSEVWKSGRGRHGGGTFAHKQIAIAYAKYLSPEFHMFVNEVFMEKMEEEANPELSYEKNQSRADKAKEALVRKYQREGKLR